MNHYWKAHCKKTLTSITAMVLLSSASLASAETYVIGTGSQTGTYYPYGGALAKIWSESIKDFDMKVEVTAASVENIIKINKGQQLTGLAMGNVIQQAHAGQKPFPQKLPTQVLVSLYPNAVQIVIKKDSGIRKLTDLKGKKVSVGAAGSGTRVSALEIFAALGLKESDFSAQSLNFSATAAALADGQIDAGVIVSAVGTSVINELALTRDIEILSFSEEDLQKVEQALPSYIRFAAPENAYNKTPAFTVPSVWNALVVSDKLDEELAYQMTKATYENAASIAKTIKVAEYTLPENAEKIKGVPLHPGALRYLKEVGAVK